MVKVVDREGFLDVMFRRARPGDERAWRDLYRRLLPRMHDAAASFASLDREDIVHEVLCNCVAKGFPGYRGFGLVAYVRRAVRNRCIDETRRKRHGDVSLADVPDLACRVGSGPAERLLAADLVEWAMKRARVASADQVLLRLDAEGWSHAEIGRRQGMSPGQVAVRLHRARKRLRGVALAEGSVGRVAS